MFFAVSRYLRKRFGNTNAAIPKKRFKPEYINPNKLGYSFLKVEYERIGACTVPELGYGYHRVKLCNTIRLMKVTCCAYSSLMAH